MWGGRLFFENYEYAKTTSSQISFSNSAVLGAHDHSNGQFLVKSFAFRTPGFILYYLNTTKYLRKQASFDWCF